MASLYVPSLKVKDFSTPSLLLIDGHHSLERMAVDWIALFTTVLSNHMCRRNSHEAFERRPFPACGFMLPTHIVTQLKMSGYWSVVKVLPTFSYVH